MIVVSMVAYFVAQQREKMSYKAADRLLIQSYIFIMHLTLFLTKLLQTNRLSGYYEGSREMSADCLSLSLVANSAGHSRVHDVYHATLFSPGPFFTLYEGL